jgi:hypothetical protein
VNVLVRDTGNVLRLRARIFSRLLLSRFTPEAKRAAPYRLVAMLLLGGALLLLFGVTLGRLLTFAFNGQSLRPFLLPALVWSPTAATVGIFFYAVLSLTATFTYRNDLSLLMLSPISPRVVLADKLFAVCASFSVLMLVVVMPDLIGAGRALHAGTGFTLVALAVVLAVPIPAAALAMLLSILMLRWLPPARARGGSAVIGTIVAAILYTTAQTFGDVTVRFPWGNVNAMPAVWPGHALGAAADGHIGTSLVYLVSFVLLALGLASLAVDRAAHLLASGWTVYGEIGRRRYRGSARASVPRRTEARERRTPDWWPVVRKEWLTLRRDPKLLAQLAYPLLIEGYSFYHAFGNPFTAHAITGRLARFFAASLYLSSSMTALFLLSVLALPIVSREGRSLYLLSLVPVRPGHLLFAKVLFCLAPVVALLEVLLVTMAARLLSMSPLQTLYVGAVLFALVSALGCWLVCVGLIWPRLTSDGSRRQVHGTALLIGPISGGVLCTVVGFLLAGSFTTHPASSWAPIVAGAGIFVLTGAIVVAVFSVGPRIFHDLLIGDRRPA